MNLLIIDHIQTARHSLRRNRMRTALTTLGIAIGIASVTTILSLAQGVTNSVSQQVDAVGGNVAVIRPASETSAARSANPLAIQQYSTSSLREADLELISEAGASLHVAPLMTFEAALSAGDDTITGSVLATSTDLAETADLPLLEGEFIRDSAPITPATIGQELALELFGETNPIGKSFTIRETSFVVVGTFERTDNPVNYNGVDFDRVVAVRLVDGKALNDGQVQIQQINVAADSSAELDTALARIETDLEEAHGSKDFSIVSGQDVATPTNQLFDLLTRVMIAIAAISLVVGGIGIMNIMLVSVAERTREIGIRKSVGASSQTILSQFLVESLLLSLMGGIAGLVLGVAVAYGLGSLLYLTPVVTWPIALVGVGLAIVVGVGFGIYPALKAARKDPIESLRQYR